MGGQTRPQTPSIVGKKSCWGHSPLTMLLVLAPSAFLGSNSSPSTASLQKLWYRLCGSYFLAGLHLRGGYMGIYFHRRSKDCTHGSLEAGITEVSSARSLWRAAGK